MGLRVCGLMCFVRLTLMRIDGLRRIKGVGGDGLQWVNLGLGGSGCEELRGLDGEVDDG